jgi:maltodextrin utilization protein YvdJ
MAPLIASIVTALIQNNLPKVAQAVVDKGLDYAEDKLGVKLEPNMSAEKVAEVQVAAQKHEEFKIQADMQNTADARDMNGKIQESANASWLAKNAAYIIDFVIILSTIVLSVLAYFQMVPDNNKELVYMALGSLITLTGTVVSFHRGSSQGSKDAGEAIRRMKG